MPGHRPGAGLQGTAERTRKGGAVRDEEGEGWQPTWVPISLLTRDLNKVAREMEEEKYGGAGRTEATTRPGKRRRSERLAAIEEEAEE